MDTREDYDPKAEERENINRECWADATGTEFDYNHDAYAEGPYDE
jgi:hypothetical protein